MKSKVFIPPPAREIRLLDDEPQAFKRILIMEDDPELCAKIKVYLEARFFDVMFAKSGISALREVMDTDFDVIICNMIKPNFSGQMFHVGVGRIKPHLCNRFIFVTGHGGDPVTNDFIRRVNGVMLWKPFDLHILLETIQLVLKKQANAYKMAGKRFNFVPPAAPAKSREQEKVIDNIRLVYLSLDTAKTSIRIVTSYFLANDAMVGHLVNARRRGVKVEILLPERKGDKTPDKSTFDFWKKLLDCGVQMYETQLPLDTGRLFICDDRWVCFSRSNFDCSNLDIFHRDFAELCLRNMEKQKALAQRVTFIANPEITENDFPGKEQKWSAGLPFYKRLKLSLASL